METGNLDLILSFCSHPACSLRPGGAQGTLLQRRHLPEIPRAHNGAAQVGESVQGGRRIQRIGLHQGCQERDCKGRQVLEADAARGQARTQGPPRGQCAFWGVSDPYALPCAICMAPNYPFGLQHAVCVCVCVCVCAAIEAKRGNSARDTDSIYLTLTKHRA